MADCQWWDAGCHLGNVGSDVANDALTQLVNKVIESAGEAFAALGSVWVLIPTPTLTGAVVPDTNASASEAIGAPGFTTILGWVVWISLAVCIMSLIAVGAQLAASHRRGEGAAHLGRLGTIAAAVLLISGATSIVAAIIPGMGVSGATDAVGFIQDSLWWYVAGFAVLSIIIASVRMAWTQRMQPGKELLQSLLTLVVVSSAGLTGIGLAVTAADGFAIWILDGATDRDFGENIVAMITIGAATGIGLIALLIIGSIAMLFSYIQIILMVIRGGMLVLLAGIFPISASFTNTETGRAWFKKCTGWLIAFILYKPAAAIVYAAAFKLTSTNIFEDDGTGLVKILTGLALMAMALVALPALMRFVAPMVSQTSGGGGAGMALAAAGGAAALSAATGAIKKASSGGGMGGGNGGGDAAAASGARTAGKSAASHPLPPVVQLRLQPEAQLQLGVALPPVVERPRLVVQLQERVLPQPAPSVLDWSPLRRLARRAKKPRTQQRARPRTPPATAQQEVKESQCRIRTSAPTGTGVSQPHPVCWASARSARAFCWSALLPRS
jgi:type IV secretion system protein TrbL